MLIVEGLEVALGFQGALSCLDQLQPWVLLNQSPVLLETPYITRAYVFAPYQLSDYFRHQFHRLKHICCSLSGLFRSREDQFSFGVTKQEGCKEGLDVALRLVETGDQLLINLLGLLLEDRVEFSAFHQVLHWKLNEMELSQGLLRRVV
jgi:hypothetical protein